MGAGLCTAGLIPITGYAAAWREPLVRLCYCPIIAWLQNILSPRLLMTVRLPCNGWLEPLPGIGAVRLLWQGIVLAEI
ncbi:hypothetical protein AA18889_0698 [Acetobacter senegalensis DSM 18889]|nr:hypothetical protein AA18889_0698 [Acetobacter senegalensis DSM 18889]